ncbi:MAG TPA: DNA polymerase IV [Candidatus Eisenbergiella merdigallinarum]|uniref:DNA polymerase IV n=1 Tax=Candidatus Eisenbergiella merdigallinarum TaxID=2838552 RepID=A0A9D2MQT8_9FIRM|nr:DNA polymerase IV [Candidatus Eisenbergiella merdigallinarum]
MGKIVFHIDVNSAFLSWSAMERLRQGIDETDLRTVPSAVGGDEEARHGVVLAKSTPAGKYGVTTGEPLAAARRKCPGLIVIRPDFQVYVKQSNRLRELLGKYTDQVIPYSIDEAWAEFEGFEGLYGDPEEFANRLREEIRETLGFTVNIGVSTNRLLSKMAGDFKKPDLVHTLFPDEISKKLWPLPVGKLLFVGRAAAEKLRGLGIYTIGDLANADPAMLKAHMKKHGEALWNYAWGREPDDLFGIHTENKGYGNSVTTAEDVTEEGHARQILLSLCETVGIRLRADHKKAGAVSVGMRTGNFENSSRQMQLDSATDVTEELFRASCSLLMRMWDGHKPLRLLNVTATRLTEEEYRQYDLFDRVDYGKLEKADRAMDSIRARFGEDAVMRASFLKSGVAPTGGGLNREKRRERMDPDRSVR